MATLSLSNFTNLVSTQVAAAQSACAQLVDFAVGSANRAVVDANATVALWLQWLILQVLSLTRAATSNGTDLDSWMADYSFARISAVASTGQVTLYRYVTGTVVLIYPGAQVKTADGTQTFTILSDPTNITGRWNGTAMAYGMAAGASSINALVQAVNVGTQGNVVAGAISLLANAIPGIDYCSNTLGFTNGVNSESDPAFRARFQLYINSRSLATYGAVQNAVAGVQQGLSSSIQPGVPYSGTTTVYVDDGSGATPAGIIASVLAAVNAVRAVGTSIYVLQSPVTSANINIGFTSAAGYTHATQIAAISAAVTALVGALPVGSTLAYTALAAAVFGATPGIAATSTLTVNGSAADLPPGVAWGVIRLSTLTVA